MAKDKYVLENELFFFEKQASIRRELIALPDDEGNSKEKINELSKALVPFYNPQAIELQKHKSMIEILFLREKLKKMRIKTVVLVVGICLFSLVIGIGCFNAFHNPTIPAPYILVGMGIVGFLVSLGSTMKIKLPVTNTELEIDNPQ